MNHRERFVRALTGKDVDRVPFIKVFGGDNATQPSWEKDYPGIGQCIDEVLGFEGPYRGWLHGPVNVGPVRVSDPEVIEEDSQQIVTRNNIGQVVLTSRTTGFHSTIEWPVKNRADWERMKQNHFGSDDPVRYGDWQQRAKNLNARNFPIQLDHGGVYGFARNVMGDENLAYAFYDDPELVHDIMDFYTDHAIRVWSKVANDVQFDLIECWEDMASKNGSIISPATFREFMTPNYRKIAAFAKEHGIEIILVDSDGYIDDLTELMLEAGVTAMYPYEVQAGCDCFKMLDKYPTLGIIGGLNKQSMAYGKEAIDKEMEKARQLIRKGRFIPGPDHFVLSDVTWENYRYFMERMKDVVVTTKPGT